jgi:hypothetical protein
MKRGGKFEDLLPRAMRGEPLHLPEEVELEYAALESAREALTTKRLPDDQELEVLLALIDNHMLRGPEGRLESWYHDERQRHLLCAKHLLDVGKGSYCAALGLKRLRDKDVELKLRTKAVRLLKQHSPQSSIERDDLHGFKTVPSAELVAYVGEHMPDAEAKMQTYARSLVRARSALAPSA